MSAETNRTLTVEHTIFDGNLFSDPHGIDVAASVDAFANACEAAILAAYPEATVETMVRRDTQGSGDGLRVYRDDGLDADAEHERIEAICERVWGRGEWIVLAEGGVR